MFFAKEIIEFLLTEIYNNQTEICGNLGENSDTHELKILYKAVGEIDPKKGRNLCNYPDDKKNMTSYLYHTHPITAYAYPSFEDIWTVVKERDTHVRFSSFIFTIWGVWILMPNSNKYLPEEKIDEIKKYYEKHIMDFHAKQKGEHKSIDYSGELDALIASYIDVVHKTFKDRVSVRFVPWENLEDFQI
jgi:hypothetical protein